MSGTPGAGNNDLQSAGFGARGPFARLFGRAMSRQNTRFVSHAKLGEHICCLPHDLPIRLALVDNTDRAPVAWLIDIVSGY
jgi:hypothetical protein